MIPIISVPYGINAESICVSFVSDFKAVEPAIAISVSPTGASNRSRYIQTCKNSGGTPFAKARVVSFIALAQNCNLGNVPLLSKPSILYTINKATPASAITITLHADAYARLAEDADIVAALEAKPLVTLVSA
jgi:hypothetical protein